MAQINNIVVYHLTYEILKWLIIIQLAIQWGAIGDVGLVIDSLKGDNETVVGGTLPQRITSCMDTIDFFLQQPDPVLASMVLADKKTSTEGATMNLVDAVANILGSYAVFLLEHFD